MRVRSAVAVALFVAFTGCKPGVSPTNELCGKAATRYAQCALGSNATVEERTEMEVRHNRWTRLCRAVYTGVTDALYPGERELYAGLVAEGSAGPAKEFECAARATTCEQADACQ